MTQPPSRKCPDCDSDLAELGDFWVCGTCPFKERKDSDKWAPLIGTLPSHLAFALQDYSKEIDPLLKLHRICDFAELCVRFHAAIALAAIEQKDGMTSHKELRATLSETLQRPTFGQWINITKKAKGLIAETDHNVPPGFVDQTNKLLRLVEAPGHENEPKKSVKALRNSLAHDGRFEKTRARELLDDDRHEQRFHDFCESSANFFDSFYLVGISNSDHAMLLRGTDPKSTLGLASNLALENANNNTAEPGDVILTTESGPCMKLPPLLAFETITKGRDITHDKTQAQDPPRTIQAYDKTDKNNVPLYSVFGGDAYTNAASKTVQERFSRAFPLSEWRDELDLEQTSKESKATAKEAAKPYRFRDIKNTYASEDFVGRESALEKIEEWCVESKSGAASVFGQPGMGKTSLMVRSLKKIQKCERLLYNNLTAEHFFRSGDGRCSIQSLVRGLLYKLQGRGFESGDIPGEADDAALCELLRKALLKHLHHEQQKNGEFKIIVVLDGLDELPDKSRAEILRLIESCEAIGLLWIFSSRPESDLLAEVRKSNIQLLFGEDGLPGLEEDQVRELLIDELNSEQRYEFLREEQKSNQFLTTLTRKAHGLPLYLNILLQQLRSGDRNDYINRPDSLPDGLEEYYTALLQTNNLDPAKTILPDLIALLAHARTPLPEETIEYCFSKLELRRGKNWDKIFKEALRLGHTLTKKAHVWEGEQGLTLYHPSFREYLLQGEGKDYSDFPFGDLLDVARNRLESMCLEWKSYEEDSYTRSYAIRHAVDHLLDRNLPPKAYDLLVDLEYMEERLSPDSFSEFIADIADTADKLTSESKAELLRACRDVFERNGDFILAHPRATYQCLANDLSRQLDSSGDTRDTFLELDSDWRLIVEARNDYYIRELRSGGPPSPYLKGSVSITRTIVFSGDGELIASASFGKLRQDPLSGKTQVVYGGIQVHTKRGKLVAQIVAGSEECCIPLAFGGERNEFLLVGREQQIEAWDLADQEIVGRHHLGEAMITAWSARDSHPAQFIGRKGKILRFFNPSCWETDTLQLSPTEEVLYADISSNGEDCLIVTTDRNAFLFQSMQLAATETLPQELNPFTVCVIGSDGNVGPADEDENRSGYLWQSPFLAISEKSIELTLESFGRVANPCMTCSCDGRSLALLNVEESEFDVEKNRDLPGKAAVFYWTLNDPKEVKTVWAGVDATCIGLSPCGKTLATGTRKGEIHFTAVDTFTESIVHRKWAEPVTSIAFTPCGNSIATANVDVRIDQVPHEKQPLREHGSRVTASSFSADGQRFASGDLEGKVILWDTSTWNPVAVNSTRPKDDVCWGGHEEAEVGFLSFTNNGRLLISVDVFGQICLWDATSGAFLDQCGLTFLTGRYDDGSGPMEVFASCCSEGRYLAVAVEDTGLGVWSISDELTQIFEKSSLKDDIRAARISPDGSRLAVLHDETIVVYTVQTGDVSQVIQHNEPLPWFKTQEGGDVAFVVGASDFLGGFFPSGTVKTWNILTGELHAEATAPQDALPTMKKQIRSHLDDDLRLVLKNGPQVSEFYKGEVAKFTGNTDLEALTGSLDIYPYRVCSDDNPALLETGVVVAKRSDEEIVANHNMPLTNIRIHPDGKTWAGSHQNNLYAFRLEGGPSK